VLRTATNLDQYEPDSTNSNLVDVCEADATNIAETMGTGQSQETSICKSLVHIMMKQEAELLLRRSRSYGVSGIAVQHADDGYSIYVEISAVRLFQYSFNLFSRRDQCVWFKRWRFEEIREGG